MPKKILVVYFSQTGQLRNILDSLTQPLKAGGEIEITFQELRPQPSFPFPWTFHQFFQVMPESVLGIPCEIEPLALGGQENFDLIILAQQPWFLSPPLPIQAFLKSATAKQLMLGKPVLTVIGCRNMWTKAHEIVRSHIEEAGGRPVGNIVLSDPAHNLVSLVTIIRWMFKGKRDRFLKVFPPAGVSPTDIQNVSRFALIIKKALLTGDDQALRSELVKAGAVEVKPELVLFEKRARPIFEIWAKFIRRKGGMGDLARLGRIRLFEFYLITVLFVITPVLTVLFSLIKPLKKEALKKLVEFHQSR